MPIANVLLSGQTLLLVVALISLYEISVMNVVENVCVYQFRGSRLSFQGMASLQAPQARYVVFGTTYVVIKSTP